MLNEQGDAFYEAIDIVLEEFHKNMNFDRNNFQKRGVEVIASHSTHQRHNPLISRQMGDLPDLETG